jgi:predicted CoA-substrate-specific enzyme activase
VGTPIHDIVAGLCLALARNFRSDIGRGKEFKKPILFQGGVSKNSGMIRAFEQVLRLKPKELIIPKYQVFMAAIGVALLAKDVKISFDWQKKRKELLEYVKAKEGKRSTHEHLRLEEIDGKYFIPVSPPLSKVDAYLGIDVGSISTNIVAIDNEGRILSKVYLRTGGDPLNTVREGLQIINKDTNGRLNVVGVGTTGSGREMIGRFVGADVVKNEITSQATAALYIDPKVDTVFEIGGQDSKFIRLKSGAVVDFAMNKACAAGTGSFLEEQGERLNISIDEFGEIALRCERPVRLGERCTVFMESDLIHHQQRGSKKEELIAGLAYSIVYNYLNRVVGNHKIGEKIFFQGGVAWNKAVLAAFRKLTGREVHVPPHHDVT